MMYRSSGRGDDDDTRAADEVIDVQSKIKQIAAEGSINCLKVRHRQGGGVRNSRGNAQNLCCFVIVDCQDLGVAQHSYRWPAQLIAWCDAVGFQIPVTWINIFPELTLLTTPNVGEYSV
jgi:hypothetical protein